MKFEQINMNSSFLHSENLRAELQEAHHVYVRLGEPRYTNYLKELEEGFAEFDHCMAIILDVAYMTSIMIPLGKDEDGVTTEYLHCDRNKFYISEGKLETEVDPFIIMEDIIDKRLKYGRLLRNVDGIDLLESISETKDYLIAKLDNLKQSNTIDQDTPFQILDEILTRDKLIDTWINDIENM